MSCFGGSNKKEGWDAEQPTYDFRVPTPALPPDAARFVVVGPTGAGKRTLATVLAHSCGRGTAPETLDEDTRTGLRLRVQYAAAQRLAAALEESTEPLDKGLRSLLRKLRKTMAEYGPEAMVRHGKTQARFLACASELCAADGVRARVEARYTDCEDAAAAHWAARCTADVFSSTFQPTVQDIVCAGCVDGPDLARVRSVDLEHEGYPAQVTVVPGAAWEAGTVPDSALEGPYTLILVVPVDDYANDRPSKGAPNKTEAESPKQQEQENDEAKAEVSPTSEATPTATTTTGASPEVGMNMIPSPTGTMPLSRTEARNKVTEALRIIEELRCSDSMLFRNAENVVLVLSHADLFEKMCPDRVSIKRSFPDFGLVETTQSALAFVEDEFNEVLRVVSKNKVCSLISLSLSCLVTHIPATTGPHDCMQLGGYGGHGKELGSGVCGQHGGSQARTRKEGERREGCGDGRARQGALCRQASHSAVQP